MLPVSKASLKEKFPNETGNSCLHQEVRADHEQQQKAVAALEEQWLQSQKTNNPDLTAPLLADKFVDTSSDGKVMGKADFLAEQKSIKWSSAENSDVKVMVFGNTAIATGTEKWKGTDASGQALDENERWTDTWVKMPSGKWQCVASHQSRSKM